MTVEARRRVLFGGRKARVLCEQSVRRVLVYASASEKAREEMGLDTRALDSINALFDLKPSDKADYDRKFDAREVDELRRAGKQLQGVFDEFSDLMGRETIKNFFSVQSFRDQVSKKFETMLTEQRKDCFLGFTSCQKRVEQDFFKKFPAEQRWSLAWLWKKIR